MFPCFRCLCTGIFLVSVTSLPLQVLVSWLMCSHRGNWELLLFSLRSCCIPVAVHIAITWLCCAQFTGKYVHCQPPLSCTEQPCVSRSRSHMLAWKRLARQRGWSPVVRSGLKEPRSTHKEIPLFFNYLFTAMFANLSKLYKHSSESNFCSYG